MKNICICAIDTEVGKSVVSATLCKAFNMEYFKVVQAGAVTDNDFVQSLFHEVKLHPAGIMLQTPASPHIGILQENKPYNGLAIPLPKNNNLIIELSGGLYCPLDLEHFMIDYITHHKLPVFLVSKNYLGSINHTILSIKALQSHHIDILGIIISGDRNDAVDGYLKNQFSDIPFFFLPNIEQNFDTACHDLKQQICLANLPIFDN